MTPQGYRLLAPTFQHEDPAVGRISTLEPGICENGTIYSHVNIFMMMGLLRYGKADKAYDVFRRVTPGYISGMHDRKEDNPPYVFANAYYGPDHRCHAGLMEFTWITGSVAWFYNVILRELVGVRSEYEGLRIAPCLPSEWNETQIERQVRGKEFKVSIRRTGQYRLSLNGKPVEGNLLPWDLCTAVNVVSVEI